MEDGDLQLFFQEMPRLQSPSTDDDDTSRVQSGDSNEIQKQSTKENTTTKSVRSVSCILNIERNGKFKLSLVENHDRNDGMTEDEQSNMHTPRESHSTSTRIQHQPLSGEWFLTPNPYCVTDRYYDTLLLVSDPRLRRKKHSTIIEKATVELRCKIWGRYGVGPIRKKLGIGHGRVKGRMTHGTIVVVREEIDDERRRKKVPTREVVGTFCGRTIVDGDQDSSTHDADRRFDEDDYDDDDELHFGDNFDEFGVLQPISNES